jgi:hypothetical protein
MVFLRFRMECKTSEKVVFFEGRSPAHGPADDEQGQFKNSKKNLYTPIASKSKNDNFLYTQSGQFFSTFRGCFHQVQRSRFGWLRQNRPEMDQPASQVVEFTLTNHVHFSLTCCEAKWGRA